MCFKTPDPPEVPEEDPELKAQREAAAANAKKSLRDDKNRALSLEVARLGGFYGARSLTGSGSTPRGFGSSLLK